MLIRLIEHSPHMFSWSVVCTEKQFAARESALMILQDGLTGSAWGDWANYTASPLRAFENELGVQAPVGFWDPVGFTADGDVASFKRRRSVELKHGRISMMATMGDLDARLTSSDSCAKEDAKEDATEDATEDTTSTFPKADPNSKHGTA